MSKTKNTVIYSLMIKVDDHAYPWIKLGDYSLPNNAELAEMHKTYSKSGRYKAKVLKVTTKTEEIDFPINLGVKK